MKLGLGLISSISQPSECSGTKWFAAADIKQEYWESNLDIWDEWSFNKYNKTKNF